MAADKRMTTKANMASAWASETWKMSVFLDRVGNIISCPFFTFPTPHFKNSDCMVFWLCSFFHSLLGHPGEQEGLGKCMEIITQKLLQEAPAKQQTTRGLWA